MVGTTLQRIVLRPGEQGKKDWSLIMREVELFRDMSSSGRVCQLYGYASNQEFVYLAMELCQEDLRS